MRINLFWRFSLALSNSKASFVIGLSRLTHLLIVFPSPKEVHLLLIRWDPLLQSTKKKNVPISLQGTSDMHDAINVANEATSAKIARMTPLLRMMLLRNAHLLHVLLADSHLNGNTRARRARLTLLPVPFIPILVLIVPLHPAKPTASTRHRKTLPMKSFDSLTPVPPST